MNCIEMERLLHRPGAKQEVRQSNDHKTKKRALIDDG
jgi:hypothetical protein